MKQRYRSKQLSNGDVEVTYYNGIGRLSEETYSRIFRLVGGYVYDITEPYDRQQVCQRMCSTGHTLTASEASFIDTIRSNLAKWAKDEEGN